MALAVRSALLAALMFVCVDPCSAAVADFEDLSGDEAVTDQYLSLGLLFAGADGEEPPVVHDYGDFSLGKVIRGDGWSAGVEMRFVEPGSPSTYRPVRRLEFTNAMTGEVDRILVRTYDAAGQLLDEFESLSPETVTVEHLSAVIARVVVDDVGDTSYVLDDVVFPGVVTGADTSSWGALKILYR